MDCKEFQEYISPLVDNQIDEQKRKEAEEHLNKCTSCFFDYKIELLVKRIVSFRFQKSVCPEVVKNQIIFSLVSKRSLHEQVVNYLRLIFVNKYLKASLAIGVLVIFALLVFNPFSNDKEKYYQEFAAVIYRNCIELRNHNFPEKTIFSSNLSTVMNFISANGVSNPKVPKTDWTVLAAGMENYNDYYAAHLLFKCEDDTVYLMECNVDKIYQSSYLNIFERIHKDLIKNKYVKLNHNDCLIVLRIEGDLLMAYAMKADNLHPWEELVASLE